MKDFGPGKRSKEVLDTCHPDLRLIMLTAWRNLPIDISAYGGARTFDEQLDAFISGNSKLDPRIPEHLERAMHVITEDRPLSMAVDICLYVPGRKELAFHKDGLTLVAGHILATAISLYKQGKVKHILRWGGNWDRDGEILTDQNFDDSPHFELHKPKQIF